MTPVTNFTGIYREQASPVCKQARMMASRLSFNVSNAARSLSSNLSRNPCCLRAGRARIASAYTYRSRLRIIVIVSALALLLPIGALAAVPVAALSPVMIAGFLSFGLMALLYLVTEELLVEAHEKPDTPLISSMFFVGFLALLTLEEMMG